MKKLFLFLFAVMFASQAWAVINPGAGGGTGYNEKDTIIDGITYHLLTPKNSISGTPHAAVKKGCGNTLNIPDQVVTRHRITNILANAFENCQNLESITIPNSVNTIDENAFHNCSSLESITIPSFTRTIGDNAFNNCSSLTSITWNGSAYIKTIGNGAFSNCTSLESVTIPSKVTTIGDYAFSNCTGLTSITLPDSIKSIGNGVFKNCTGLTSITLPDSIKSIGEEAFAGCSELTSITIPSSVTSISENAFAGCSGLTSIIIPSTTSIGENAFSGCNNLTTYYITDNGIKYRVLNENSVEVVSNDPKYSDNVVIHESVTMGGKEYAVKSIGDEAFSGCSGLTSATIPSSVTHLGSNAFSNCSQNLKIYITDNGIKYKVLNENSVEVVANAPEYSGAVTIPESVKMGGKEYAVTSIGNSAFNGCSELTSITIPSSVTSISENAFAGCSQNLTIYITNNRIKYKVLNMLTNYSVEVSINNFYSGEAVIPASVSMGGKDYAVTSIGNGAFKLCGNMSSVTIPNSVTSIGDNAFYVCKNLTSVTIPNSVTSIGNNAFFGCSGLSSITIGNSVTSIGANAFYGCSGLTSVTIPNSVTSIGNSTFAYCTSLSSITIPSSVKSIASNAFLSCSENLTIYITDNGIKYKVLDDNYVEVVANSPKYSGNVVIPQSVTIDKNYTVKAIGDNAFGGCSGLTSITIPNTVTSIGSSAFRGCSGLTSVIIPNSVTTIGDEAFYTCRGLSSVTIPNSVTTIGEYAFGDCRGLSSVTIPNSVTTIGNSAFRSCYWLESIVLPNSITAIGESTFSYCYYLSSITIPNSVTTIGDNAFENCNRLESIDIPNSVTSISANAFALQQESVSGTTLKTLSYNTDHIGTPFAGCKFLSIVNMGKAVTTFNIESFVDCPAMESFNVDDENAEFSSVDGILYNKDKTVLIYCPALKKGNFTLPKTVTSIAEGALQEFGMTYSTSGGAVYLGDSENPYQFLVSVESPDITTYSIEPGCKYIVGNAFNGCSKLAWVYITESVADIGDKAFNGCNATLYCEAESRPGGWSSNANIGTTIMGVKQNKNGYFYSPTNNQIRGYVGSNKIIEIPHEIDGVTITSIGAKAFSICPDLQSVTIPAAIKSIDKTAFSGCNKITTLTCHTDSLGKCFAGSQSLKTVKIGNEVSSITDGAFEGCSNLRTVDIGVLVKSIGDRAFANCSELRDLTIVSSALSTIGKESFRGCYKIKTITVPDGVSAIGKDAFHYVKNVAYHGTATGSPWGALTINGFREGDFIYLDDKKEKITAYIGDGEEAVIPQSVNNIGPMAFFESDNLKKVTILDNSVAIINESAFGNCRKLESVNIPKTVAIIGYGAFRECYSVKVYCEVSSKPDLWNENWNYRINDDQIVWGFKTAVSDDAANAVNIYAYGNTIVVENATGEIRVYDAMGKLVCRDATNRVRAEITIPSPGVYIVKTGNIAQRVMAK